MFNKDYLIWYLDIAPKLSLRLSQGNKMIDDDTLFLLLLMSVFYYRIDMSCYFGCLDSGLI